MLVLPSLTSLPIPSYTTTILESHAVCLNAFTLYPHFSNPEMKEYVGNTFHSLPFVVPPHSLHTYNLNQRTVGGTLCWLGIVGREGKKRE